MAALSTAAKRREKKKRQRERQEHTVPSAIKTEYPENQSSHESFTVSLPENPEFAAVLAKFGLVENIIGQYEATEEAFNGDALSESDFSEESIASQHSQEPEEKLSNKKRRKLCRLALADLKRQSPHPEVVELEDTTAKCPLLLIQLKCVRNSVPVPRHWSRKRKYLAGKRGFVKPPFELPPFIRDTGITEQREAIRRIDDAKSLKAKARDRMHPKLGRLPLNYEALHDAFFKYQSKPPLSGHGQLYYEGRETVEGRMRGIRPGRVSEELMAALGMTGPLAPPPWLYSMQRFGPPPSYPNLRIPGVNAALPEGAQWGYHPGGWGRPPADDAVLAMLDRSGSTSVLAHNFLAMAKPVERQLWGALEPEEEDGDEGGNGE